jgi:hypothetical protein
MVDKQGQHPNGSLQQDLRAAALVAEDVGEREEYVVGMLGRQDRGVSLNLGREDGNKVLRQVCELGERRRGLIGLRGYPADSDAARLEL